MNICIVCDQYPIPPRTLKMRNSILKMNHSSNVRIYAWNRAGVVVQEEYVTSLNDTFGYGNQYKKLVYLIKFLFAFKEHLNQHPIDILHGVDFEMAFVCSLLKKDRKLIYEVYDIKFFANRLVNQTRVLLEKWMMRKVDGIIYASPFFSQYYQANNYPNSQGITINNKPLKSSISFANKDRISNDVTLGFIGVLRYKEILVNLLDAIAGLQSIHLLLAGSGPDEMFLRQYVRKKGVETNVTFTGRFDLSQLAYLYSQCDFVWAAYPNKDANVYYAVSNKFFESIAFNKRVIVSIDTLLAQWVKRENLGFTVDPYDVNAIRELLVSLKDIVNEQLTSNSDMFWENEEDKIKEVYSF
jgi:glycosyltransferase involved in cell wall biosynthesis